MSDPSYDSTFYDYLDSDRSCSRDIPFLQKLQTNVVRTCGINPSQDHSGCMTELANAGIYVLIDLMTPGFTLSTTNPVWNDVLYDHYTSVVDAMHSYSNLLGFVIGDDVANGIGTNASGSYVKAAVRDVKAHIRRKNYRTIPVGYVGSSYLRWSAVSTEGTVSDYLNCGNQSETIDFWGLNMLPYGNISEYANNIPSNYSVPIFMASYGWLSFFNGSVAIDRKGVFPYRPFSDISILFGAMSSIWSGGLIYQFMGQLGSKGYGKHPRLSIVAIS